MRSAGKQAPRDLEPRRLGLILADQPARAVGIDLAELVAIDRGVERLACTLVVRTPTSGRSRTRSTIAVSAPRMIQSSTGS